MFRHGFKLGLIVLATIALLGCGSGDNSSPTNTTVEMTSPDSIVGVLLTDGHSDEIEQLIATISKIEFISDGQRFTVFNDSARVDLLKLRDFYELFTVTSIRSGTYQKISLHISDVTIVAKNELGILVETMVTLPSQTIDVEPAGGFTLAGGQVTFLEIDFDVDKSIKLMTDTGGSLVLTPVIFMNIAEDLQYQKFTRIHGVVDAINHDSLRICNTQLLSDIYHLRRSLRACADVRVNNETSVFGANGIQSYLGSVVVGDAVSVVGRINRRIISIPAIPYGHLPPPGHCRLWYVDRSNGDQPPPQQCENFVLKIVPTNAVLLNDQGLPVHDIFGVDALVIQKGSLATFSRYRGKATTVVADAQFDFLLDSEQGVVTDHSIRTLLFPETRIFSTDGVERSASVIQPGGKVTLDGVLVLSEADPDVILASFVVVKLDETAEQRLVATVFEIDPVTSTLTVTTDKGNRCIDAEAARVFRITVADDRMVTEAISLSKLMANQPIDIFGVESSDGCFSATSIFTYWR